jgi:hypothetical protein
MTKEDGFGMPPSESIRRARYDDVEEYIRSRKLERARRSRAAAGLDVLDADAEFTWDTPPSTSRRSSPGAEVVDADVLDLPTDAAWRAAAAARHASPRSVDELLDEWGSRLTDSRTASVARRDPFYEPRDATTGRRTVVITGRGAEGYHARRSHKPALRPHERAGFKPDRVAMWAVLLGLALLLGAATSSHAATLAIHAALHTGR